MVTLRILDKYNVILKKGRYKNGNIAIRAYDVITDAPIANVTVNPVDNDSPIEGPVTLLQDEVAIKIWGGNKGILEDLIKIKFIEPPYKTMRSGFVKIPICKINDLDEIIEL